MPFGRERLLPNVKCLRAWVDLFPFTFHTDRRSVFHIRRIFHMLGKAAAFLNEFCILRRYPATIPYRLDTPLPHIALILLYRSDSAYAPSGAFCSEYFIFFYPIAQGFWRYSIPFRNPLVPLSLPEMLLHHPNLLFCCKPILAHKNTPHSVVSKFLLFRVSTLWGAYQK